MGISKIDVIETAASIADEFGVNKVSLKTVAEKLNIKSPSLYNHIKSLDELLREVAHMGMKTMNERMMNSAIGVSGDEAIKKVSLEYFNYIIEHPGIYETIQWATWHGTEETSELFNNYTNLLKTLIKSCNLKNEATEEILNLLTGILHGFTTLQLRYALNNPNTSKNNLLEAMDTVLIGVRKKYSK